MLRLLQEFSIAFFGAGALSLVLCGLVRAADLSDLPNEARKADRKATATSGGLGFSAAFGLMVAGLLFIPGLVWSRALSPQDITIALAVFAFAGACGVLGFADDVWGLSAKVKFGLIGAFCIGFALIGRVETLPLWSGFGLTLGPIIGALGTALWLFTLTNATNFMDGANGQSIGATAIGLIGLGASAALGGAQAAALLALCASGALFGFLWWNFHKGVLFAGDCGALFAGALAAGVAILMVSQGAASVYAAALCFLPGLADVLLTLAWRVKKKRNLLEAHRDHLYQVGAKLGAPKPRIVLIYWALSAHCAASAALTAFFPPAAALLALGVHAAIALRISGKIRRLAEARGVADQV